MYYYWGILGCIFSLVMTGLGAFMIYHTITRKGITPPYDGEPALDIDEPIDKHFWFYGMKAQYYISIPILGVFFLIMGLSLLWMLIETWFQI
jgi:hypothetical protein